MNSTRASSLLLVVSFGLGCGASAMNSQGSGGTGAGGQITASGGSPSSGGIVASGGLTSTGGTKTGSGGTVMGGKGGSVTGGKGGTNAGGAGGTICPPMGACPAIGCLYGEIPNPDRCGCPICAPAPDAGVKDAAADACLALPCLPIVCGDRELMVTHPCGCPTCAPLPDAGTDSGKLACVDLDECTCLNTKGCTFIAEACYCPTQCTSVVCVCGGGKFLGCAPQAQGTCATARERVAGLCPALKGAVFDGLCQQTDSLCVTKCLNAVVSCGDLTCSMCEGCDCASDPFMRCRAECGKVLAQ